MQLAKHFIQAWQSNKININWGLWISANSVANINKAYSLQKSRKHFAVRRKRTPSLGQGSCLDYTSTYTYTFSIEINVLVLINLSYRVAWHRDLKRKDNRRTKLMHIPDDDTQNYPYCSLQLVVATIEHST